MALWNRIDELDRHRPSHLEENDLCYYAREYTPRGGWQANQLIHNFKKSPDKKGTGEWYWKDQAAKQFAEELATIIPADYCVAPIPTSKPSGHPNHDERFYMMLGYLNRLKPALHIEEPIVRSAACQAQHDGGSRSIQECLRTLTWKGFESVPTHGLFFVDDVITAGTSFKACQRLLWDHHPSLRVGGLFWARTVRQEIVADWWNQL